MTSERLDNSTIVESNGSTFEVGQCEAGWITIRRVNFINGDVEVLSEEFAFPPHKTKKLVDAIRKAGNE